MAKMSQKNIIFGHSLVCLAGLFIVACSFVNIHDFVHSCGGLCKWCVMGRSCYPLSLSLFNLSALAK